jgi:glycosyltransferase involved in cell wall biosynthesis/ubiquinone/menaquinone biosynthesis C-methylase UbiE
VKLSVIIPAYNEAGTIKEIVRRVQETPFNKEILVVDDGSTDGTREVLAALNSTDVKVIFHESNRGKGAAVRTGFAAASGDYVILQDADLEYDPRDYAQLLEPLIAGDADVVYGSRFTGSPRRVLLYWHTVANRLLTLLSNMVTNLNLTDMETGYKAFRIDVVRRLSLESNRFGIEPEITAKVAKLRCRIYEVPISYRGRTYDEGKKIRWTDGVSAVRAIIRYGLFTGRSTSHAGEETLTTVDALGHYNEWLWKHMRNAVGQRVFEAGCGTGTITRHLAARERLIAADIDHHYVATLQGRYADRPNVQIEWADFASDEWPSLESERIDTVVCMNVLEHLPDDRAVLERFNDILEPGGRLVLLVPAHQWLYGSMDEALGHYRRYELPALSSLCQSSGFAVEKAEYLNPTGVVGWFLNARFLRRREVPDRQARLYDALFPLLVHAQDLGLQFGLSILVIARKPGSVDAATPERASAGRRTGKTKPPTG